MATTPDATPLPEHGPAAAVTVPRHVLESLAAAAGHRQVPVDPVTEIRAGRYPTSPGGRTVTYQCADDCPACGAHRILRGRDSS